MRIAYLDCFSGMSGDMFLGALVDAGVPTRRLEETVAALELGARLEISRVMRSGISATKVDVWVDGEKDMPREEYWSQKDTVREHSQQPQDKLPPRHAHNAHGEHHDGQEHEHGNIHEHGHDTLDQAPREAPAKHEHKHAHGRGLSEIRNIIGQIRISDAAKKSAVSIFEALGAAEAKIHDVPVEQVHFHEVGAVDAMVDIICAAVGVEALGVEEIICSPLNVGGGMVKCAHGMLPVPTPATVELLKGVPVYSSGVQAELVTPTGAAIVRTLADRFAALPSMKMEKTGHGAGSRDFPGHPNVVRLVVGEASATDLASHTGAMTASETVTVLEANLDDLNPQVFGYVMDRLLEEGALDIFGVPVQMKKNRPGVLLTVLCRHEDAKKLSRLIFTETTTLGVRQREEVRQTLPRRWESVQTQWGEVRIKVANINGSVANYAPEYEDCRRIAAEHHVPLKVVMQEAARVYTNSRSK